VEGSADALRLIKHIGESSTVLLKNSNATLPLKSPRSIALIGSDIGPSPYGPNSCPDRGCDNGTLAMGWGSGTADFPYLIDPFIALSHKARDDQSVLNWWFDNWDTEGAATTATGTEVAIVGTNSDSGEQYITFDGNEGDRNNLSAWLNGDELVLAVVE
jgi:beta-glucosidase